MNQLHYRPIIAGVLLSLAALILGELHGMAFGAREKEIKSYFQTISRSKAAAHDGEAAAGKAAGKAWTYLKRAHMHFMGLGAAALVLCLLIGLSPFGEKLKLAASAAVGFGALVYPLFWTLVAPRTAALGAHQAKESLGFIAQAGAGVGFLGLLATVVLAVHWALREFRND